MTQTQESTKKAPKFKGPIRWEAIIPIALIYVLISLYMTMFFDLHLRKGLELGGYYAVGSEVNIASLDTSFFKASIRIQGIQLTNPDKPTHNTIEIGDIRFSMLWDALLRGKVVINELAVEQIKFNTKRAQIGKVKPPEPPKQGPGVADQLKKETLALVEKEYQNNVLSDIAAMLGGQSADGQLSKLESKLVSKGMISTFEQDLKTKKDSWEKRIASLPQGKDIEEIQQRLAKIQTKDFKTPQELEKALKDLDAVFKDTDAKIKIIQTAEKDFKADLKDTEKDFRDIENQIKEDIKGLQAHFKIPQLDAAALSKAVFMKYLSPYISKGYYYKDMAEKYLPPKFTAKKSGEPEEVELQPRPRDTGVSYEFGRPNSYPLVWIKRVSVSSQAGSSPGAGNVTGEITHITSHPRLIKKPTTLKLSGGFPSMEINDFKTQVILDITGKVPLVDFGFSVGSYPLAETELIKNNDISLAFAKAAGNLSVSAKLTDFKNLDYKIQNQFTQLNFNVTAKNKDVNDIVGDVMKGISSVSLEAWGKGELPRIPFNIKSNLGEQLAKGFEIKIQSKIDEAKQKIQAYIDEQIGIQKRAAEEQIAKFKAQAEGELKKAQAQFEQQKKAIEAQVTQAKKSAENQAKSQIEKEKKKLEADTKKEKKKLEDEAKKKANELKKKLGL